MMLIEETAVPQAALPVAELRAHLRLGTGFAEDGLQDPVLESFLRAAVAAIEARTGKILISRTFVWTLNAWRDTSCQAFPVAPVSDILDVVLIDRLGLEDIVSSTLYRLEEDLQRPRLAAMGAALPMVPSGGSVRVRFDAGYGVNWGELPADLGQAVLLLGAHYYEFRHETTLGEGCMPFGVSSLIERYRTVRMFGGAGK